MLTRGWGLVQRAKDAFHDPGEIGIDVRIPKSQNPETLRLQESVTNLI
jgi:hypothetical protein